MQRTLLAEPQTLPGDRSDIQLHCGHVVLLSHIVAISTAEMDTTSTGHQLASRKASRGNTSTIVESAGFRDKFPSLASLIFYEMMKKKLGAKGSTERKDHFFQNRLSHSLASRYDFTPCTPTQRVTTQRLCPL